MCQLGGPATVLVAVAHKDNRWTVSTFNVESPILGKMNEADQIQSRAFVDRIGPWLCGNLSVDSIKKVADSQLASELNNPLQSMATNAVFTNIIAKSLGTFKRCDKAQITTVRTIQSQFVYDLGMKAEYEKGQAIVRFVVAKVDGQWKVKGFNIQPLAPKK